jgi:ATP-dependent Lon protease
MDDFTKSIAMSKLESVCNTDCNGESMKIMNWINQLCKIPIGKYNSLPINHNSSQHEISEFLGETFKNFNENIYGHIEAKEQVIRILAQWISNPHSKGNVIGIHGNPGVGKTTLVKECICKSLNLPFQFIPLGGASDGSYLEGHSFTYEGSIWGKIVDCLMKSDSMNPVLYFDELDKVSDTPKGQELINILIHLTDPSQNTTFYDKYFGDIPIDLSKCLIIFTYNNDNLINPILKDRMIRIHTEDYNVNDKLEIVKKYTIPGFNKQFKFEECDLTICEDVIKYVIHKTDTEAGVRNLNRSFELIYSNINLARMIKTKDYDGPIGKTFQINSETNSILPITITKGIVDMYIKDKVANESHHHLYM